MNVEFIVVKFALPHIVIPDGSAKCRSGGSAVVPYVEESAMRGKLITKRLVDVLKAADGEYFVWDRDLKGFGVRVQRTGERSYVVKYRAGSGRGAPTRRVTLGPVGTLTPDEARRLAKTTLGSVAHGLDPATLTLRDSTRKPH